MDALQRYQEKPYDEDAAFSVRYHVKLAELVSEASNDDIAMALRDYPERDLDDLFQNDPLAFHASVKRSLANYFSDEARNYAIEA